MKLKPSEQAQSWVNLIAHYVPVAILAAVFGWLVGVSNLISDDHMVVSIVAPTVAGMSVLGVVTLAGLMSFVGNPASLRIGVGAGGTWLDEQPAAAPDEPSHIHISRQSRGERT